MTLKEKLAEKKAALKALEEGIKAGEEGAIAKGEELVNAITEIEKSIKSAEKAQEILQQIGANEAPQEEDTAEENGLKNVDFADLKRAPGSKSVRIKANTDNEVSTTEYTYDHKVISLEPKLDVRGLFGQEKISTNALTYYVLDDMSGTIGTVAEGAVKSQINIPYTAKTVALSKIAAFFKETDELLSDNAFLETAIRSRGVYEFNKAVESYLITTLTGTSGIQTNTSAISFDTLLAAKQDIMADTGYAADAIVINPADWATLLQSKDSNNQYLLGGPAYGSYGNGGYNSNPKIWGLNVIESSAMTAGTCLVGAFKAGASVVTKANEGFRVEVSNSDQDDFIYNRVTVRLEERLVEAVRIPSAFYLVGTAT